LLACLEQNQIRLHCSPALLIANSFPNSTPPLQITPPGGPKKNTSECGCLEIKKLLSNGHNALSGVGNGAPNPLSLVRSVWL